ncbi:RNA polymerase sigma factor [Streptomyces rimosus]|uniref:RNA polymerase sigma factor n=1 Tax=Streptomyces rimosus TaxID=1927 RepID=UPI00067B001C|nr:sigma-70 family RNA polymerase sigma factor [Streptomyces rimosus]
MPSTPSASKTTSCDGEFGSPLEAAAARAAKDPSNKAALAEVFGVMYEPIVRFMNARIQDPSTAEDLAQETFVKVVQKIDSYDGHGIRAWVFAIARNVYNDYFRPMRNRGFEKPTSDFWQLDYPSTEMGPEERAEWNELGEAIRRKLDKLSDDQQLVLALRITSGHTTAETAEIMGKPVGTIRVLQYRALARLRTLMPERDSTLAAYLLSAADGPRDDGRATPVMLREKNDAGSKG